MQNVIFDCKNAFPWNFSCILSYLKNALKKPKQFVFDKPVIEMEKGEKNALSRFFACGDQKQFSWIIAKFNTSTHSSYCDTINWVYISEVEISPVAFRTCEFKHTYGKLWYFLIEPSQWKNCTMLLQVCFAICCNNVFIGSHRSDSAPLMTEMLTCSSQSQSAF